MDGRREDEVDGKDRRMEAGMMDGRIGQQSEE